MISLHEGQCGLCRHFGEGHDADEQLVQIRNSKQAPAELTDECGHPEHEPLHLVVTPASGCEGFERAA